MADEEFRCERWAEISPILDRVLDLPTDEISGHLDEICDGDPELRTEIESLLAAGESSEEPFIVPAAEYAAPVLEELTTARPPSQSFPLASRRFRSTQRFEDRGILGSGAFGDVYRVYDRKRGLMVALKILCQAEPDTIGRFKKEFRALTDLAHPNLVQLYELSVEDGQWFFVMELVEGLHFLDYVGRPSGNTVDASEHTSGHDHTLRLGRLRRAFRQLAEGLFVLHQSGKLHRDIKPSNIKVAPDGRVVLLDFGLVKDMRGRRTIQTTLGKVAGTPIYMSPEQARGEKLTPASDWYAAGIVLFEAMTGQQPFEGTLTDILTDKQSRDVPSPREVAPELPEDLAELCVRLTARDPRRRPTGEEVLDQLGEPVVLESESSVVTFDDDPFVGRETHLEALVDAFERVQQGHAAVVTVHGSSGIGKSALLRRFIEQTRRNHDHVVVLSGRCFERESVPYKALDSLIDPLSQYLRRLSDTEAQVLLPTHVQALAGLFPALRRIDAVAQTQGRLFEIPDEHERRRRARHALRELLARLSERRPVILCIDDLQWGDSDSAGFLSELFQSPCPVPLLLILCFRTEEQQGWKVLSTMLAPTEADSSVEAYQIALEPLSMDMGVELAQRLLGGVEGAQQRSLARAIVSESQGNPFLICELARYAREKSSSHPRLAQGELAIIGNLVDARLDQLSPEAVRILQFVALAGRPLDLEVALGVAEADATVLTAIANLRAAKLIRSRKTGDFEEIETYHDQIRQAVVDSIDPAYRAEAHRRLARALGASGRADPETLAAHLEEAGEYRQGARFLVAAAERANEALAFDRAAGLYNAALDTRCHEVAERHELLVKLGDTLANAGRGAESADAYLAAVADAEPLKGLELRRRAAEERIHSGHFTEGLATLRETLALLNLSAPESTTRAVVSLLWQRLRLRVRQLTFRERDSGQVPPMCLIRADTCLTASLGYSTSQTDILRGFVFHTRYFRFALDTGDPYRIAQAVAMEVGFSSFGRIRARNGTSRLARSAMKLANRINDPRILALANMTAGLAAYLEGRGRKARALFDRCEKIIEESCVGYNWVIDSVIMYKLRLLFFLGQIRAISDQLPSALKYAVERDNFYAKIVIGSSATWVTHLAADQAEDAGEELKRINELLNERLPNRNVFTIYEYMLFLGQVESALYRGQNQVAWDTLEKTWPKLRVVLLAIELSRAEALHLRCRVALAVLVTLEHSAPKSRRILKLLKRSLRRLRRQRHPWSDPWEKLIRAGFENFHGRTHPSQKFLGEAIAGFETFDMELYAAVSRRRQGQLLGGDSGKALVAEADRWMQGQKIRNPERFADMLAPGIWRPNRAFSKK